MGPSAGPEVGVLVADFFGLKLYVCAAELGTAEII
jgi:hypothetical protein